MGFVWVHDESFLHSVASPFHSFVTTFINLSRCTVHECMENMLQTGRSGESRRTLADEMMKQMVVMVIMGHWRARTLFGAGIQSSCPCMACSLP